MLEEGGNEQTSDLEAVMPQDSGFSPIDLRHLKRKKAEGDEYFVYSDKTEFKTVEAETAIIVIEKEGEGSSPYKIVPAYRRIDDVLSKDFLEYVEEPDADGVEGEAAGENAESPAEETKAEPEGETPPAE